MTPRTVLRIKNVHPIDLDHPAKRSIRDLISVVVGHLMHITIDLNILLG